jgi:2-dehydropantoate 2-reductase
MRIAVFGVGAVGAYFGWRLAHAGEDVVSIARGENFRVLSTQGLKVETLDGKSHVQPVQVVDAPGKAGQVDAVLLGVKAWQVPEAAQALRPLIGPETFVVPLQNGVEAPSQLADALGREHAFGGLCYIVSLKIGPGHFRHGGLEPRVLFGELDNRPSERARQLQEAFLAAGVKAEIPRDIHVAMWEKFLFIASLSGVGAVTRAPAGIMRSIPEARRMLEMVAGELVAVAKARGIALKEDAVESTMALIDALPPNGTASMQRDIMDGQPSELSAQNGAAMRLGAESGLPTPVNTFIYSSLLPLEMRARGQVQF